MCPHDVCRGSSPEGRAVSQSCLWTLVLYLYLNRHSECVTGYKDSKWLYIFNISERIGSKNNYPQQKNTWKWWELKTGLSLWFPVCSWHEKCRQLFEKNCLLFYLSVVECWFTSFTHNSQFELLGFYKWKRLTPKTQSEPWCIIWCPLSYVFYFS